MLLNEKYRIVCKIGEGGMGVVYLGRDIYLNIDIAIKILPDSLTRSVDVAKRFAREIRL